MAGAIWITGLPGSGKTVIAEKVEQILRESDIDVKVLQLDEIRKFVTPNPSYSEEERDIVYGALVYMAKLLVECDKNVIIDATANRRKYREKARRSIKKFAEVYVKCSLRECVKREKKRRAEHSPAFIYDKAKEKGATVPGVNVPYEAPENAAVVVDSEKMSVEESAKKIARFIKEKETSLESF
jgi:adenylylsulfate kinase